MKGKWVLAAALVLASCKLIDQTTFAPSPEESKGKPSAPQADKRKPLVTIDYGAPNPDYQDMLRYAVRAAETRVPGVNYDVIGMLPPGADTAAAQHRTAEVMRDIMAQGVPAGRIHLGLRAAPKDDPQEVRIYVR